jgi:hypothetical protein
MYKISDLVRKQLTQYEVTKNSQRSNQKNQLTILEKKYSKKYHERSVIIAEREIIEQQTLIYSFKNKSISRAKVI